MFNAKEVKNACVQWIKDWFDINGEGCNAVVGISGGKDSSVVAALCAEALGKDRVIGVLMPNGNQSDIQDSKALCDFLNIENYTVNIREIVDSVDSAIRKSHYGFDISYWDKSEQAHINLPPRIRMAVLYAISQSHNGRVANTCNLSEDWVGYSTRYGDGAGDFSPLSNLTVTEVKAIGKELGLPNNLIDKIPSDGLCGKTDEDNLGFTYECLDKYIRNGICDDIAVKEKIDNLHTKNMFKLQTMPCFKF